MVIFLLIVIIGMLIYIICEYKKEKKTDKKQMPWGKLLPEYVGKNCEIVVKDPLVNIDIMYSVKGILTDVDDEWLEMECTIKKKKVLKIFRIDNTDLAIVTDTQAQKYTMVDLNTKKVIKSNSVEIPINSIVVVDKVKKINK